MYLPRSIDASLLAWTREADRKPLVLRGARQTGSLKSLHQFLWRAGLSTGIRLHVGLPADERLKVGMPEGELAYRLLSLPLYLAEKLPALDLGAEPG